jgi:phosphonate transport system ATP-binding protein
MGKFTKSSHLKDSREIIKVINLSKSYKSKKVLREINLNVNYGESIALIGANGSGKSTLIKCLLGLTNIEKGEIYTNQIRLNIKNNDLLKIYRRDIAFIWQTHNLVPRLSVLSNVIHGSLNTYSNPRLWYQAFAPSEIRSRALNCLEEVGLKNFAKNTVSTLSGGESQRVAIARALMQKPKLIIADEPVASLDPKVGIEVMNLLKDLTLKQGISLFFTTHDLNHAEHYANRVLGLKNGAIKINIKSKELKELDIDQFYSA